MHGVPIMAVDVCSAYFQAPTSEKHFIVYALEFGIENFGKKALITRDLYGSKCARKDVWH